MNEIYLKIAVTTLLPPLFAALLYIIDKKTSFGKIPYAVKQIIFGTIFGALAIFGTEYGVPVNGAQLNCRDAAVLISGLMFGSPAGIIAGLIGGIERWFAVAWGVGTFTRLACTLSTIIAGFYAAALRKFMFEDKKPGVIISFAIGVVIEVLHMTMVFVTNMATPEEAMRVVKVCTVPMVFANGLSVMLSALFLSILSKERIGGKKSSVRISQTIQRWLLFTVVLAFAVTSFFVFRLQDTLASSQADSLLTLAIDDVADDIHDASDTNLLELSETVRKESSSKYLNTIALKYNISEISVVDKNGIIVDSTVKDFIGFDMSSGEQSAEFLCLLGDTESYVQEYGPISYDNSISRKYAGIKTGDGFIQIGYDAEHFQEDIDEEVVGITRNRHVGKTGYILIIDSSLDIISAPKNFDITTLRDEDKDTELPPEYTTFELELNGEKNYCRYRTAEGYYIVSVLPETEALQIRNIALYVNSFLEIIVFAVLFALIYLLIKKVVVNQIKNINSSLAKITDGDLGVVVDVRSNEEFASLSDDINMTVDTLKRYIAEASARIDKELEFAKNIQASALPNVFPAFPKRKDFDIYATMDPAKEVGGDFYDFYLTHDDTLNLLIADVSGKGIPAAMFMMRAKTELKSLTEADMPLSDVFTHGNAALCEGNDAGMFVTAWQGGIELNTGILKYANAGHNPPLVCHENGKFEYLRSRAGFVLAGMDGVRYKTQELELRRGDTVFLYTDGVTEATNSLNELYGEERLLAALNSREFSNMREICDFIKSEVDAFVGEAPQFDDITMVAFRYFGKTEAPTMEIKNAVIDDIPVITDFIEGELEKLDCPMKTVMQINVAVDEILSNIIRYGYGEEHGPVQVKIVTKDSEDNTVYIRFADHGIPYNPLTKEAPDVTLSAEERGIGGLGIYIVRKTMDDVKYKYENDQNILTIKKCWGMTK